jgi:hypothetical protein
MPRDIGMTVSFRCRYSALIMDGTRRASVDSGAI